MRSLAYLASIVLLVTTQNITSHLDCILKAHIFSRSNSQYQTVLHQLLLALIALSDLIHLKLCLLCLILICFPLLLYKNPHLLVQLRHLPGLLAQLLPFALQGLDLVVLAFQENIHLLDVSMQTLSLSRCGLQLALEFSDSPI